MPRSSFVMVYLLGWQMLSGCAGLPVDKIPAVLKSAPAMSQTLASARLIDNWQNRWPEQHWWQAFGSPLLDALIVMALADNPDLQSVAGRLRQAQAQVDAQGAELYPSIAADVSFSAQRFSANSVQAKLAGEQFRHLLINPLVLKYHLDLWGRDAAALQAAIGQALAASAKQADARLLLAVSVAETYADWQAAEAGLTLAQTLVNDSAVVQQLEQHRYANGLTDLFTVWQADLAVQAAKQLQAHLMAERDTLQHRLMMLSGRGPDDWPSQFDKRHMLLTAPPLPADLPLRLIARRPDLTAARCHVEAAAEQVKVAKTGFYPDINLIALSGLHSVSLSDIALQGASLAYAVGPSIELPIFEGGRLRAHLDYQQAGYDVAVEEYNSFLLKAVQAVADAISLWQTANQRLVAQQARLSAAEAAQRLKESLLLNGLTDARQTRLQGIAVIQEQLALLPIQTQRSKAALALIKALGGGYEDTARPAEEHANGGQS